MRWAAKSVIRGRYTRQPRRRASARNGLVSTSLPRDTYSPTAAPGLSHGLLASDARIERSAAARAARGIASRHCHNLRRRARRDLASSPEIRLTVVRLE